MAQLKDLIVTGASSFIGDIHCLGNNKALKIGNANYSAGLHMGSGGVNRGLYDFTLNKWMVYADASNVYLNGNAAGLSHTTTIGFTGGATGSLNLGNLTSNTYTVNLDVAWDNITGHPTALKNPYSLTIQGNGTTLTNGVYDGSAAKTINIIQILFLIFQCLCRI